MCVVKYGLFSNYVVEYGKLDLRGSTWVNLYENCFNLPIVW